MISGYIDWIRFAQCESLRAEITIIIITTKASASSWYSNECHSYFLFRVNVCNFVPLDFAQFTCNTNAGSRCNWNTKVSWLSMCQLWRLFYHFALQIHTTDTHTIHTLTHTHIYACTLHVRTASISQDVKNNKAIWPNERILRDTHFHFLGKCGDEMVLGGWKEYSKT